MAAKGITQEDVWNAADKLLMEGARPTIERIREEIGSGSPNTVTPLLNAWFKRLHERIKDPMAFKAPGPPPPVMPDAIHRASTMMWEAATTEARQDFDERLQARLVEGMEAALANVEAERARAAQAESAAFEAVAHSRRLEQDLASLTESFDAERIARDALKSRLDIAEGRIEELSAQVARGANQLTTERAEAQRLVKAAEARVDLAEERSSAAQRRAGLEIEAARAQRIDADKKAEAAVRRAEIAEERLRVAAEQASEAQAKASHEITRLSLAAQLSANEASQQSALLQAAQAELVTARSSIEVVNANLERSRSTVDQLRDEMRDKERELGVSIGRADAANELLKSMGAERAVGHAKAGKGPQSRGGDSK